MLFSVSASLSTFASNSTGIRVQQTDINIDKTFATQFKCIGTVFIAEQKSSKKNTRVISIEYIAGDNVLCFSHLGQVTYKI